MTVRVPLAAWLGFIIFVSTAQTARPELPPVPHYEDPFPLSSPSLIEPPLYNQQHNSQEYAARERDDKQDENETIWQWPITTYYHTIRDPVALFTFVLSVSTIGLWIVTWRSGIRQSRDIQASTNAAEDAVEASLATLAHARETADRDFRPWLTVNAKLISPIAVDPLVYKGQSEEKGVAFFIEMRCRNVGKVAALNVIYSVAGIDISYDEKADDWLQNLIDISVHACKFAGPGNWRIKQYLESSSDALAPSEEYRAKRWCQVAPLKPDSVWSRVPKEQRVHQYCVGIVAAYSSGRSDGAIFYTAKVLPIGKINLPEFLGLIGETELPVGIGEVGVGPTYKAIAT